MVKNHVMPGSTIVTNKTLYPLLYNLPGIGEVISTEALMNLDINHDQKSLKNLGRFVNECMSIRFSLIFFLSFIFRNHMGHYRRGLYSTARYVHSTRRTAFVRIAVETDVWIYSVPFHNTTDYRVYSLQQSCMHAFAEHMAFELNESISTKYVSLSLNPPLKYTW